MAQELALIGGGEFTEACRAFDATLLERSGGRTVVVLPTAAAFEHPERVIERASQHFAHLGADVVALPVLHRREAQSDDIIEIIEDASLLYIADGSPLHLRSVLKDSPLMQAISDAWGRGMVLAASGAGATVVCDPMVDPRGGAYTVGLGLVANVAIFPYHGTAADHLLQRSRDLLAPHAVLVGIDDATALMRSDDADWTVAGRGCVTVYRDGVANPYASGATLTLP
jgi:cyanophycinase